MMVCEKMAQTKTIIVKNTSRGSIRKVVLDGYVTDIDKLVDAIHRAGMRNIGDFTVYNISFHTMYVTEYSGGISLGTQRSIIAISYKEMKMLCEEYGCVKNEE